MQPLVSVIIPNYNHEPYLEERIKSVIGQTYDNIEVIILDDCSSDNSKDVIERFRNEPKVKYILYSDQNSGSTFKQWEKGFSLAQGKYLWIAESDDFVEVIFLEKLVKRMELIPESVLAFSYSYMIDKDGNTLNYTWDKPKRYHSNGIYEGERFIYERLLMKNLLYNASMIVFKKSALSKIPSHFQNFRMSGDWLFWTYVCKQGKVIEVPEKLNYYRQHMVKASVTVKKDSFAYSKEIARCQMEIFSIMDLGTLATCSLRGRIVSFLKKNDKVFYREFLSKHRKLFNHKYIDCLIYRIDRGIHFTKLI